MCALQMRADAQFAPRLGANTLIAANAVARVPTDGGTVLAGG